MLIGKNTNEQLAYNWSAGVNGSLCTDLKMNQAIDRTPLSVLSENTKNLTSYRATYNKNQLSSASYDYTLSCLQCCETIQLSPTDVPVRHEATPKKIVYENYKEILIKFWTAKFLCHFQTLSIEIFENLTIAQLKTHNVLDYLTNTDEINSHARALLVEWMTDVTHDFKLTPDTLFMAVNYLDRFLSNHTVAISGLQLLGMVCLIISSKLNDKITPQIYDFAYLMEDTYTKEDIIDVEKEISCGLGFNFIVPTTLQFVEIYMVYFKNAFTIPENILFLQAICEFLLTDYDIVNSYYPSTIAAAAILFASNYINGGIKEEDFNIFSIDASSIIGSFQKLQVLFSSMNDCQLQNSKERLTALWPPYCSEDECLDCMIPNS